MFRITFDNIVAYLLARKIALNRFFTVMRLKMMYRHKMMKLRKLPTYKELHIMKIRERFTFFPLLSYQGKYAKSLKICKTFIVKSVGTICAL